MKTNLRRSQTLIQKTTKIQQINFKKKTSKPLQQPRQEKRKAQLISRRQRVAQHDGRRIEAVQHKQSDG